VYLGVGRLYCGLVEVYFFVVSETNAKGFLSVESSHSG